jgi:hypothetical protein
MGTLKLSPIVRKTKIKAKIIDHLCFAVFSFHKKGNRVSKFFETENIIS